jgi:uncharacterized protein with HEPN domain
MIERIVSHRLADIVEAIERLHKVLDGVNHELFEHDWEKRWLVERGIEVISEASRHAASASTTAPLLRVTLPTKIIVGLEFWITLVD